MLSQYNEDIPIASIQENEIGEIPYTYETTGLYYATLPEAHAVEHIYASISGLEDNSGTTLTGSIRVMPDGKTLRIKTVENGEPCNGLLAGTAVEICIYTPDFE